MGPASNPNLSFSTNFAERFYYFEKMVSCNPNLSFTEFLIVEEDKSIKSSLYFVVVKPMGVRSTMISCLEDMWEKELEGRQMGQCPTNLITCYKTFQFEKKILMQSLC
jgi:hypothetical protein